MKFLITIKKDSVIFTSIKSKVKYTLYSDGVFYSSDNNDIPTILFEMRDIIKE